MKLLLTSENVKRFCVCFMMILPVGGIKIAHI